MPCTHHKNGQYNPSIKPHLKITFGRSLFDGSGRKKLTFVITFLALTARPDELFAVKFFSAHAIIKRTAKSDR